MFNRAFYSYGWKQGWRWPCFDTNLPALLCKSSYSYANQYFSRTIIFPYQSKGGLHQKKVTVSLTCTRRHGTKSMPVKWSIILTGKRKEIERKKKDTCLILHDGVTPLTTLLVSKIKMAVMAAQRYHDSWFQMSCKAFFSDKWP